MKSLVTPVRITQDSRLKLKLLSVALGRTMTDIVSSSIDKYWEQYEDLVTSKVTSQIVQKEVRKIFERTLNQ